MSNTVLNSVQMKKILLTFYVLMACGNASLCSICMAQSISSSSIMNTKWIRSYPNEKDHQSIIEFTKTKFNSTEIYTKINKTTSDSEQYYLSDTVPSVFDFSKVGKQSSGKYLLVYVADYQEMYIFKIVSLTNDILKIYFSDDQMEIYKRIKN